MPHLDLMIRAKAGMYVQQEKFTLEMHMHIF